LAELALDDPEGMLDLGPDHRDDAVDARVAGMQQAALWAFLKIPRTLPCASKQRRGNLVMDSAAHAEPDQPRNAILINDNY